MGLEPQAPLERRREGICCVVGEEFAVSTSGNMRIGFVLRAGDWLGGNNYLRNLFAAICALPSNTITPVIFAGKRQTDALSDFSGIEIVATSMLDRKTSAWFVRKILVKATGQDVMLRRLLQQHNVSLLSHSFPMGKQTTIKTIGWIPDFQHIHLPEFFTPAECIRRDQEFMSICTYCDRVIVSSECARADLLSFSPKHAYKAELLCLSPVPCLSPMLPAYRTCEDCTVSTVPIFCYLINFGYTRITGWLSARCKD